MDAIYKAAKGDAFLMLVALETKAAKNLHGTEASLVF